MADQPAPATPTPAIDLTVDGRAVVADDPGGTLLRLLRDQLGVTSVKDGCAPQGQCGCCTVLVDGAPRVACVTPVRRVRGRNVTTPAALPDAGTWAEAFCATGGSQCGFCTPGIIARFSALHEKRPDADDAQVEQALLAHLCRCTGWRTILDAWHAYGTAEADGSLAARDLAAAARRAAIEGGVPQRLEPAVALGEGGFADDHAPSGALVAVLDPDGRWTLGESVAAAREQAGTIQGRRTSDEPHPPLDVPDPGDEPWVITLRTSWVEPAYLETDASWAEPGGTPASPLANGGAFGGKAGSEVADVARRLADQEGQAVRALYTREDAVRRGPKRPPLAAGLRADGTGVVRVARTPGIAESITDVLPGVVVEEVDLAGPPTSTTLRAAGWAEATVLAAGLQGSEDDWVGPVTRPGSGTAWARVAPDTRDDSSDAVELQVRVRAGDPLDEVALRSYCLGAAHQAASWVTSEALTVDDDGNIHDLTIRSFGILRASDTPPIHVEVLDDDGPPVPVSDAVFAAVAAAVWRHQGRPPTWPTGIRLRR